MNLIPPEIDVDTDWLRTLEKEQHYEWIDGKLKEKPVMGAKANRVAAILIRLVDDYASRHQLGFVLAPECGYKIFPHEPKKVRKPDVSFMARGHLPGDRLPDGHMIVPPDLEVEVVSPNDVAEDIDARVADYLSAGVRLIWIIYPATRSVWLVRRDGTAARLTETQELSGEDVISGFTCPIRTLFADL